MTDREELNLFFNVWQHAVGPRPDSSAYNGTTSWLYDFGTQTKWLTGDSWTWWLERFRPPHDVDPNEMQNFISLVIGMLGDRTDPQGEAVDYARRMINYLESGSG